MYCVSLPTASRPPASQPANGTAETSYGGPQKTLCDQFTECFITNAWYCNTCNVDPTRKKMCTCLYTKRREKIIPAKSLGDSNISLPTSGGWNGSVVVRISFVRSFLALQSGRKYSECRLYGFASHVWQATEIPRARRRNDGLVERC
jgi:hypothetical protein